jgi:hypothetical protein
MHKGEDLFGDFRCYTHTSTTGRGRGGGGGYACVCTIVSVCGRYVSVQAYVRVLAYMCGRVCTCIKKMEVLFEYFRLVRACLCL